MNFTMPGPTRIFLLLAVLALLAACRGADERLLEPRAAHELIERNLAFGLEVDVHENVGFVDLYDFAGNDHAFFDVAEVGVEIVLELGLEIHLHIEIVHGLGRGLSVVHVFTP